MRYQSKVKGIRDIYIIKKKLCVFFNSGLSKIFLKNSPNNFFLKKIR